MLLQSISTDSSSLVSQFEHIAAIVVASGGFKPARDFVAGGAQPVVLRVLHRTAGVSSSTHLHSHSR